MAIVTERLNSIGASIILHMAFNLVGVFGENINMGNLQMMIVAVVSLIIMIAMIYIIMKKKRVNETIA